MDVNGKITIFPKTIGKNKDLIFETTIGRKTESKEWIDNYSIRVDFAKNLLSDDKKSYFKEGNAYQIEIEGFLTTRSYEKDGKKHVFPKLMVTKAKIVGKPKEIKKKTLEDAENEIDDDLPF